MFTFNNKLTGSVIAALIGLATTLVQAQEQEEVRVPALTGPFGAGMMEQAVTFERMIAKRHPWLRLIAQESPGFVYNIREMSSNQKRYKTTTFWTSTGSLWAAATAQKGFFPKPIPTEQFRWLLTRSTNCFFFATLDPEIKSISDFSGRRIGMGRRSQTHWALFESKILETGMGMNDAKLEFLGNNAAMTALLDGRVDVAVTGATISGDQEVVFPSSAMRKISATGRDFYNIPIPRTAIEKVNSDLGAPFVSHIMAPGKLPNQDKELACLGDYAFQAAHKDFPDKLAHAITSAYIEIDSGAEKYIGAGKLYNRANLCVVPAGIEAHPGSLKACRDAGIEPKILK